MCNLYCEYIRKFIDHFPDPLHCILKGNFEDYFNSVETDARTQYRKGIKNNLSVTRLYKISQQDNDELLQIYDSTPIRQDREINYMHQQVINDQLIDIRYGWPVKDYDIFNCDKHNLIFYVCKKDDKIVSFLELLNSDKVSVVHLTMGHHDYLKYGIMKFMFMEVIKMNIDKMKFLVYGDYKDTIKKSYHFKKDLLICNYGLKEVIDFFAKR